MELNDFALTAVFIPSQLLSFNASSMTSIIREDRIGYVRAPSTYAPIVIVLDFLYVFSV
jgi:hypothetical protein